MPRVEDFPPIVKAEVEAAQNVRSADHEEKGPMGLLKRLTNGLTRREEEPARLQPRAAAARPKLRQPAPERRRRLARRTRRSSTRRAAASSTSMAGPPPQPRAAQEDDQLEIPAFLRRQAN